ncbi:MAG: 1-aminocyclopropane-1-carboxylate deaminase, partial [Legionella sp.]
YQLSRLFLDENEIIWIERDNWDNVASLAEQFKDSLNVPAFVLTEGASVAQALPGAKTLATDIIRNEEELGLKFQHIFVDAGTGFSATALIDGLAEYNHQAHVYVLILANQPQYLTPKATNYVRFYPQTAKAFGSLNQAIKQEMQRLAREEGLLTDPVYSAKLFYESRRYIETNQLQGPVLIIHSGGLLTLTGFEFKPS